MKELYSLNKVVLTQKSFEYYNKLFEVDFDDYSEEMQDKIKQLNAYRNDIIYIGDFKFANGNTITYEMISGDSNYYESLILSDKDNYDLSYADGQDYEIVENVKFYHEEEDTMYICNMEVIKDEEDLFYCQEWDIFFTQDELLSRENKVMQIIATDNNKMVCYKKIDRNKIKKFRVGVERLDKDNRPYEHLEYEETKDLEQAYTYYSNWKTWDTLGLGKYLNAVMETDEEITLQKVGYYN